MARWPGPLSGAGQAGLAREAEEGGCSLLLCVMLFTCILGFLIIVTRKPLPPTLLSLRAISRRRCPQAALVLWSSFTGPPCAQRPPEGPSGHPDAMLHQGAFYIQLYYFYYYETFPPNSINTAFQLGGLFWGVAGEERVGWPVCVAGEPRSACPREDGPPWRGSGSGEMPGLSTRPAGSPLHSPGALGEVTQRVWDCGGEGRRWRRSSRPAGRAAGAPWRMPVAACSARRSPPPSKRRWRKSGSLGFLISPVDSPLQVWPGCRTCMGAGA